MNAQVNSSVELAEAAQTGSDASNVDQDVGICCFAPFVGVTFADSEPIAKYATIVEYMASLDKSEIVQESGLTTFNLPHSDLSRFCHMLYCDCPEDKTVNLKADGIYAFHHEDEQGVMQKFNAQLFTLSESEA